MTKIPSYLLNLAGEYRVCSELCKRGAFATVTYGTRKGVDLYVISDQQARALRVEVKTSQGPNFVTGLSQKCKDDDPNSVGFWDRRAEDPQSPDFWVLFQVRRTSDTDFSERFFILTHGEICTAQSARNAAFAQRYRARHGKDPNMKLGVDNVILADVERFEDRWQKILNRLNGDPAPAAE